MIIIAIGIMILGICSAVFTGVVKYKVFKAVFDGNFNKYAETKVLERQFKVNRAKEVKEVKNEA